MAEPLAFYCNKKRSSWKDVRTSRTGREDNIYIRSSKARRDMVAFIKKLLPTALPSLPLKEDDIRIDRAHTTQSHA
ncbi:hypothetical protein CgunFtcFv8_018192 [Champsocephalus gunnari]|uniref:Uncharacterized protein n=1 Tax=Champsocephalus gunnari TaxID=52237 RepID=A0AAN8HS05_CHAGU|nr:hypothetical protein CgunFtcFv8_018192 [Champsocephalus gunnari]